MKNYYFCYGLILAFWFAQIKVLLNFLLMANKFIIISRRIFQLPTTQTPYVKHQKYGETSEHRNLNVYYILLRKFSQFRTNKTSKLASIGLVPKTSTTIGDKLIVWLSFQRTTETMGRNRKCTLQNGTNQIIYIQQNNKLIKKWLKNTHRYFRPINSMVIPDTEIG